jgi:hypothetical protein
MRTPRCRVPPLSSPARRPTASARRRYLRCPSRLSSRSVHEQRPSPLGTTDAPPPLRRPANRIANHSRPCLNLRRRSTRRPPDRVFNPHGRLSPVSEPRIPDRAGPPSKIRGRLHGWLQPAGVPPLPPPRNRSISRIEARRNKKLRGDDVARSAFFGLAAAGLTCRPAVPSSR